MADRTVCPRHGRCTTAFETHWLCVQHEIAQDDVYNKFAHFSSWQRGTSIPSLCCFWRGILEDAARARLHRTFDKRNTRRSRHCFQKRRRHNPAPRWQLDLCCRRAFQVLLALRRCLSSATCISFHLFLNTFMTYGTLLAFVNVVQVNFFFLMTISMHFLCKKKWRVQSGANSRGFVGLFDHFDFQKPFKGNQVYVSPGYKVI